MKTYAIVCKQDQESITLSEKLKKQLNTFLTYNEKEPDIVISVGGDGTMLYSVHKYIDAIDRVAFIGIHTGTLGFLTDYQRYEYLRLVFDIQNGQQRSYERHLLEVSCLEGTYFALNEVRIENNRRSQVMDVYINDEYFETFRGNGLCVSTPIGSSA